jgi:hypothetical protein
MNTQGSMADESNFTQDYDILCPFWGYTVFRESESVSDYIGMFEKMLIHFDGQQQQQQSSSPKEKESEKSTRWFILEAIQWMVRLEEVANEKPSIKNIRDVIEELLKSEFGVNLLMFQTEAQYDWFGPKSGRLPTSSITANSTQSSTTTTTQVELPPNPETMTERKFDKLNTEESLGMEHAIAWWFFRLLERLALVVLTV